MPKKKEENITYTALPNSVEAEQNVLCCIMRNQDVQLEILAKLDANDFYQPNHAIIFDAMKDIGRGYHPVDGGNVADTVNFTTVVDSLRRSGKLAQVGDIDYILSLNDMLPGTANYNEYVAIVKRASLMRQLISVCGEITQLAYSSASAEDAIAKAEEMIFNLSQHGSNGGLVNLADVTARTLYKIGQRFVNPEMFRGVLTGFSKFDKITNGLHGSELIVLAARPGVGKSALSMNIAENVAKSGKTVAVFSLEMSNEQLMERMLSSMSTVPMQYIKNGQLPNGEADLNKIRNAQDIICSTMHLYGNDYVNIKPSEITSQCRRLKMQHGLDLVIIDYIQLMNSDASSNDKEVYNRATEVQRITRALKLLAKELNVPVIALSQLKRDVETRNLKSDKADSEPELSDLRESGSIEQDADIVLFIHKYKSPNSSTDNYSLIIKKHRNGECGSIPMFWLGNIVRFVDEEYLIKHNMQSLMNATQSEQKDDNPEIVTLGTDENTDDNGFYDGSEPEYYDDAPNDGSAEQ